MTDYTELVKALRWNGTEYKGSTMDEEDKKMYLDAADSIEKLQKTLKAVQKNSGINFRLWKEAQAEVKRLQTQLKKRDELILTNDEIETIRIHMNAIKEQLCNQYRHYEAEAYQTIVDKLAKMEVQG